MHKKLIESFDKHKIDAYIIPTTDEYQNEYSPDENKRLEFITGFTGSNGFAIIARDKGYFYTDGRYLLQAREELDDFYEIFDQSLLTSSRGRVSDCRDIVTPNEKVEQAPDVQLGFPLDDWRVGFNPKLLTPKQIDTFFKDLNLVPIEEDLVLDIWQDRPEGSSEKVFLYDEKYAGLRAADKIKKVREAIGDKHALITDITSICWLLNIRAKDIEFSPLLISRLIISQNKIMLFTDLSKIRQNLDFVEFHNEEEISDHLKSISSEIMIDPATCNIWLKNLIIKPIDAPNPIMEFQMIKEEAEIEGARKAHIEDAVALCEAFAWIEKNPDISEYEIGEKLISFRKDGRHYVMDSFPSIVGFKERGAIIHYRATKDNALKTEGDGMLLIDSGGHYLGGTTDITRNIYFGNPTDEIKRHYTLVLKCHLALMSAKFKPGTSGKDLDIITRKPLKDEGLDYAHGTGHGVGNFLSVHEGSIISPRGVVLKPGMILSNEPGYYKEGEYGIRIENLLYVRELESGMLGFENLTLMPYCHNLIDITLLNNYEIGLISSYYDTIKQIIIPLVSGDAKIWLEKELSVIQRES